MAIELFKPFVMKELVANGTAHNIKNAKDGRATSAGGLGRA